MSSLIKDLFTTPTGIAFTVTVAAALMYLGTQERVEQANLFAIRQAYDNRNSEEVTSKVNRLNDPFNRGITSIPFGRKK